MIVPWVVLLGLLSSACLSGVKWPEGTIVGCSMTVTPFGQTVAMWAAREVDETRLVIRVTVEPTCRMTIEGDSRLQIRDRKEE